MKNLTWQNPEQLFVAQELINKVKSKCCGIKVFMFCSAKVTWFMQNASEAIECLRREHGETLYSLTRRFIEHRFHGLHGFVSGNVDSPLTSLMRRFY